MDTQTKIPSGAPLCKSLIPDGYNKHDYYVRIHLCYLTVGEYTKGPVDGYANKET